MLKTVLTLQRPSLSEVELHIIHQKFSLSKFILVHLTRQENDQFRIMGIRTALLRGTMTRIVYQLIGFSWNVRKMSLCATNDR